MVHRVASHPTRRLAARSTCKRLGSRYSGFLSEQGVTCGSTMLAFKADGCPMARSFKGHANHGPGTACASLDKRYQSDASLGLRLSGHAPLRTSASTGGCLPGECLYGRVSASMGTLEDQIHMPPGLHWTQDVPLRAVPPRAGVSPWTSHLRDMRLYGQASTCQTVSRTD